MVDPRALAEDSLIEEEFLQELKANGMSDHTLKSYQKAVRTLEDLDGSPEDLTKRDLMAWIGELEKHYADSTANLYKACVKRYFKWLNGGEYPKNIDWLKTKTVNQNLPKEILSRKEIKQLAGVAEKKRDRAMIWVGYESGCRPGELLTLKIGDVEFDEYGAQIIVDGKTGERRIRLVESVPDLKEWLSIHPNRNSDGNIRSAFLWPSSRGVSGHLENYTWNQRLRKYAKKAGIEKHLHAHLLRHSRATHLAAQGLNESQLREIFGWKKGSKMPGVYVHLSGRDTDSSILNLYGIEVEKSENQLEMGTRECPSCGRVNSPSAGFCSKCGEPMDPAFQAEESATRLEKKDELTKKVVQKIIKKAPEIVEEVMSEQEISREVQKLERSEARA